MSSQAANNKNSHIDLAQPENSDDLNVVILAGGEGRRVGYQQKALLPYHAKPVIQYVIDCLEPQCRNIVINANAELPRYEQFSKPLFVDDYEGFLGPLAGMHAAWDWVTTDWVVFVPCDNPHLPEDLVKRMLQTVKSKTVGLAVVDDGERMQPLYLMMHRSMKEKLQAAIELRHLSVNRWVKENSYVSVDFSDVAECCFQNMNSIEFYDKA